MITQVKFNIKFQETIKTLLINNLIISLKSVIKRAVKQMTSVIKFNSDSVLTVSSIITDRGNKRSFSLIAKAQNLERS